MESLNKEQTGDHSKVECTEDEFKKRLARMGRSNNYLFIIIDLRLIN